MNPIGTLLAQFDQEIATLQMNFYFRYQIFGINIRKTGLYAQIYPNGFSIILQSYNFSSTLTQV